MPPPDAFLEAGYYNAVDKANSKKPFAIFLSLIFPFAASSFTTASPRVSPVAVDPEEGGDEADEKYWLEPYPPLINVHVIRIVDFVSAVACALSVGLILLNMYNLDSIRERSGTLEYVLSKYFGAVVFALLVLDKLLQVKRMPAWTGARALAFRLIGPEFLPIASSARQAQQLIMGIEMFVFTFPPFVDLVFGAHTMAGLWWIAGWRAFYTFWFFSMALVVTCPVWSFTGLLMKWRLITVPDGKLTPLLMDNITPDSYYCQVEAGRCTGVRYGKFGPYNSTRPPAE